MIPYWILSAAPQPILKSRMSPRTALDAMNSVRMDYLEGTGLHDSRMEGISGSKESCETQRDPHKNGYIIGPISNSAAAKECSMKGHPHEKVTQLLEDWRHGDHAALDRLMPLVHDKLHRLAREMKHGA